MVPKKRRVRDLKRTGKDSRLYREQIEAGSWVPHVLCDSNGAYWDGFAMIDRDGRPFTMVSDVGRRQMINMILDGDFGEEVKDVYVDQDRYWKIRDDLVTWPNQDVILKEALRVFPIARNP